MDFINIAFTYGWLVRRAALAELGVSMEALLAAMQVARPLDSNEELISFAPSSAQGGPEGVVLALRSLGLVYFDDFVETVGAFPPWCCFRVGCNRTRSTTS